jgi:hypothetical protein
MKVHEILGKAEKKGDVGIEIECEGKNLTPVLDKWWKTVDDASLRGLFPNQRCEYVLVNPIPIKNVKEAVQVLVDANKVNKSEFNFSFRTSVHVHLNVNTLTEQQVLNLIYTYLLLEEPFMDFCGKERKGNRFCLRLQDAEGLIDIINGINVNGIAWFLGNVDMQRVRYGAINLHALQKYGSVEFRGMRGNIDPKVIDTWCKALVSLRTFAENQPNIFKIYELFQELGAVEFLKRVLGELSGTFIGPKLEREMAKSFSLSMDIPFAWRKAQEKKEIPVPKVRI